MRILKVFLLLTIVAVFASCGRNATQGNAAASSYYSNYINSAHGAVDDPLVVSFFGGQGTTPFNPNTFGGINSFVNAAEPFKAIIDVDHSFRIVRSGETLAGYNTIEYFRSTWRIQGAQFIVDGLGASAAVPTNVQSAAMSFQIITDREVRLNSNNGDGVTLPQGTYVTIQYVN